MKGNELKNKGIKFILVEEEFELFSGFILFCIGS